MVTVHSLPPGLLWIFRTDEFSKKTGSLAAALNSKTHSGVSLLTNR